MTFLETNVSLIIIRCEAYLKNNGFPDTLTQYPELLDAGARTDEESMKWWAAQEEAFHLIKGGKAAEFSDEQAARYFYLLNLLGESEVVRSLVDLSIASFYYAEFDKYLEKNFGERVCLKLAFLLEGKPFPGGFLIP